MEPLSGSLLLAMLYRHRKIGGRNRHRNVRSVDNGRRAIDSVPSWGNGRNEAASGQGQQRVAKTVQDAYRHSHPSLKT